MSQITVLPPYAAREYQRDDCAVFCKTDEDYGGLSNMAAGYPITVNNVRILTSEALYQACRFPHLPEVQREIVDCPSPMGAKMIRKQHTSESRSDWESIQVEVMRWCLRCKLVQNWVRFSELLRSTDSLDIVEESHKDRFWGAVGRKSPTLTGCNVLGRLLMELRGDLPAAGQRIERVEPPQISNFLLYGQPIGVVAPFAMVARGLFD